MLKYVAIGFGVGATFLLLLSAKRPPLSKNGVGIVRFLMNLGYSKANASGIAGNIYVESWVGGKGCPCEAKLTEIKLTLPLLSHNANYA